MFIPGVTGAQFREAVRRAFATWQAVPTATIRTEFQGATSASPNDADGRTTLGYLDRPDLDRVLAATSFVLNSQTGEIKGVSKGGAATDDGNEPAAE